MPFILLPFAGGGTGEETKCGARYVFAHPRLASRETVCVNALLSIAPAPTVKASVLAQRSVLMNNRLSYAAITLLLTAAAVATWIVFPPGAVGGPAIEPAVHTHLSVPTVPGIAE